MITLSTEDITLVMRTIEQLRGKHVKQTLSRLERQCKLDHTIRKALLDGFGDYTRAIFRALGYTVEE